jgi:hypothetical protein
MGIDIFKWLKDWAMPLSAGATFLLAIAAFGAIWQNHRLQKRDRKERLLNEIIKWAVDISDCNIGVSGLEALKDEGDLSGRVDKILTHAQLTEWGLRLQALETKGKYIIDTVQICFDNLKTVVTTLNDDLKKFIDSLYYCADIEFKGLSSTIYREQSEKSGILQMKMYESANKVIKEATKIKTKDIG